MISLLFLVLNFQIARSQLTTDGCTFRTGQCSYNFHIGSNGARFTNNFTRLENQLKGLITKSIGLNAITKDLQAWKDGMIRENAVLNYKLQELGQVLMKNTSNQTKLEMLETQNTQLHQENVKISNNKNETEQKLIQALEQVSQVAAALGATQKKLNETQEELSGTQVTLSINITQAKQQLNTSSKKLEICNNATASLQKEISEFERLNIIQNRTISNLNKKLQNIVHIKLENCRKELQLTYTQLYATNRTSLETKNELHQCILQNATMLQVEQKKVKSLKYDLQYKIRDLNRCQAQLVTTIKKTCSDYNNAYNALESMRAMIDPDGAGGVDPFLVDCRSDQLTNSFVTSINHDSMVPTVVTKCHEAQCYQRDINYDASLDQVTALVDASKNCYQYISYRCQGSILNFHKLFGTLRFGAWYNRNGKEMYYWGGATPGSGKCACGITKSCYYPDRPCNCDANDDTQILEDHGFIENKIDLPITEVRFGDTDLANENGWHEVGPLVCYN